MREEKSVIVRTAVFVFPSAAGHINPSLPVAKLLVAQGWRVEYLAIEAFQSAIEKTGATFHDRNKVVAELGIPDVTAMVLKSFEEYDDPGARMWGLNFGSIATNRLLPAYISWLRSLAPQLLVYCPVLCQVAHFAAMHLQIPDVSLLTAAGPGFWDAAFAVHGGSAAGLVDTIKKNEVNEKAVEGVRSLMKMPELTLNTAEPLIYDYYTSRNLVSTVPFLADKLNEKDAALYKSAGKVFEFVGPLLDDNHSAASALSDKEAAGLLGRVEEAIATNRSVVYVSMGTVLTGDDASHGWTSADGSALTGKELCQSVYRAACSVLGSAAGTSLLSSLPLVVISCGPQPDALEGVEVPENVICLKNVPQVRLLRLAKPALCIINGGQNSFMETISVGSPLVVCPGFGDQQTNAVKAETYGLGVKVARPKAEAGVDHTEIASLYQAAVSNAIRKVLLGPTRENFVSNVQAVASELKNAGGVEKAVQILVEVASNGQK